MHSDSAYDYVAYDLVKTTILVKNLETLVSGVNLKNFVENSREAVSVSTICDEYCRLLES